LNRFGRFLVFARPQKAGSAETQAGFSRCGLKQTSSSTIHVAHKENMAMTTYDFAPLWRSTVGFDRLFDMLEDDAFRMASEQNYPPYNIERTGEVSYEVTLAVAGFTPDEIAITTEQNVLTVEGRKADKSERHYLHHGISARAFRRQFNLADYVKVTSASIENGLLQIHLVRDVPEAMKPRRIEIKMGASERPQMEHMKHMKAAA
jgi:molecular chaperone IbpA